MDADPSEDEDEDEGEVKAEDDDGYLGNKRIGRTRGGEEGEARQRTGGGDDLRRRWNGERRSKLVSL